MTTSLITIDLSDLSPQFMGQIKLWASAPIKNGKYQTAPPFEQTVDYRGTPVQVELTTQEAGEDWFYVAMFYPIINGKVSTVGAAQVRFYLPNPAINPITYAWTGTANESTSIKRVGGSVVATNLITNPNFEVNNAGWTPVGTTLTTPAEGATYGAKSAKVVTTSNNAALGDIRLSTGNTTTMAPNIQAGKTYTASAYITIPQAHTSPLATGTSRQRRMMFFYWTPTQGQVFGAQAPNVAGRHRISVTFTVPASAVGCILAVGCAGSATDPAFTTYVDGVMLQEGSVLNDYFDGNTPKDPSNNLADLLEQHPAW